MLVILKLIKKYWYVPLLVIGISFGIVVFREQISKFFNKTENKNLETALSIQSISSIADLTTAEFYGEVTYSWADVFRKTTKSKLKVDYDRIRTMVQKTSREIPLSEKNNSWDERWKAFKKRDLYKGKSKKIYKELQKRIDKKNHNADFLWYVSNHEWNEFQATFAEPVVRTAKACKVSELEVEAAYNSYREAYIDLLIRIPRKLKKDQWQSRTRYFKKHFLEGKANRDFDNGYSQLRKLTEYNGGLRPNQDFLEYIHQNNWNAFKQKYQIEINSELRKAKPNKKELVYIGRGLSRAGFSLNGIGDHLPPMDSLGRITAENFSDTLILKDFDPFLKTTINPWFITELGIPGFQVLQYDAGWVSKKQFTFDEVSQVKEGCVYELEQDAIERDIFGQARESAELILGKLFEDIPVMEKVEGDSLVPHSIRAVRIIFSDSFEVALDIRNFKHEFLVDGKIGESESAHLRIWIESQPRSTYPQIAAFLTNLEEQTAGATGDDLYIDWKNDLRDFREILSREAETGEPTRPVAGPPEMVEEP